MNESSNAKTMYEAVPAVAELNKVPDFDPLKFLRRTKDSMRLDLPYQKLWFRMAHPNGRMRVTALRITEQLDGASCRRQPRLRRRLPDAREQFAVGAIGVVTELRVVEVVPVLRHPPLPTSPRR